MGSRLSRNRPPAAAPTTNAAATTTAAAPAPLPAQTQPQQVVAPAPPIQSTPMPPAAGTPGPAPTSSSAPPPPPPATMSAATSPSFPAGQQPTGSPVMPPNSNTIGTAITPPILSPGMGVASIDKSPAPAFAILRNSHEALRKAIDNMQRLVDRNQLTEFALAWAEYCRASRVHVAMEDCNMFPLLDSVAEQEVTKQHLPEEHATDVRLVAAVNEGLSQGGLPTAAFEEWKAFQLGHMSHEEEVVIPLTLRTAPTFEERATIVHQSLINPAFQRSEFEFVWYCAWCVRMLSTYGSTAQAPSPATRVFIGALQASTTPSQYRVLLPAFKTTCNPVVWEDIILDYNIEGPGLQPEPTPRSLSPVMRGLPPAKQQDFGLAQPPPQKQTEASARETEVPTTVSPRELAIRCGYKAPFPAAANYPHYRSGYSYLPGQQPFALPYQSTANMAMVQPMPQQQQQQQQQQSSSVPMLVGVQQSFHPDYSYVIGYNSQQAQ